MDLGSLIVLGALGMAVVACLAIAGIKVCRTVATTRGRRRLLKILLFEVVLYSLGMALLWRYSPVSPFASFTEFLLKLLVCTILVLPVNVVAIVVAKIVTERRSSPVRPRDDTPAPQSGRGEESRGPDGA